MDIFEKLPEKALLEEYIRTYAGDNSVTSRKEPASLKYLLRFWEANKSQYLFDLLGGKYIVEKECEVTRPQEDIASDIRRCLYYGSMHSFSNKFERWVKDRYGLSNQTDEDWYESSVLRGLVDNADWLATSKIKTNKTLKVKIDDDHIVIIQSGAKPVRILSRLVKILDKTEPGLKEDFEKFTVELSRILNDCIVKGTMCLSIHPLDYLTMSDNPYDWESCMNWMHNGQYRMGTVEMMNSSCVLIAYLKGDKCLPLYPNSWNGKKWRNLFIVTKDFVTGIKGYPYQNTEFDTFVLNWISDLAKENLGIEFNTKNIYEYSPDSNYDYITIDDADEENGKIGFDFDTGVMYNDFGNNNTTHIMFRNHYYPSDIYCYYSGETECMYCGRQLDNRQEDNEDLEDSGCVICTECATAIHCEGCGARVSSEDDLYELDGVMLCENCYNDNAVEDTFTGDIHNRENCSLIYALNRAPEDDEVIDISMLNEIWYYNDVDDLIKEVHHHSYTCNDWWWSKSIDYITPDDLTDEGRKFFEDEGISFDTIEHD